MCSIFGSFDKFKLEELAELNQFRGNFSYSVTQDGRTTKDFGKFNNEALTFIMGRHPPRASVKPFKPENHNTYTVCHVQAPTGGMVKEMDRIHPTYLPTGGSSLLWHNGLIRPAGIKYLQGYLSTDEEFDTLLLHKYLVRYNFTGLGDIEGLFTCVFKHGTEFYLFRTKHGKLYVDDNLTISSERFEGSKCINYDTVYRMDWPSKSLQEVSYFKTKRFNYIIEGEMNDESETDND